MFYGIGPTVVVNQSITIYASKGSHPYLYCGVRYDKKVNVTYRWYFENARIQHDSRRRINKFGQLTINGVSERDDGRYRCDSFSTVGDFSTYVKLVVQGELYSRILFCNDHVLSLSAVSTGVGIKEI